MENELEPRGAVTKREEVQNKYYFLTTRNLEETKPRYEYCMAWKIGEDTEHEKQEAQEDILKRLKDAGLIYSLTKSRDGDEVFVRIAAPMRRLEIEAERMGLYLEQKPVIVHEPLLTEEIVRELREKGKQEVEGIPSETGREHKIEHLFAPFKMAQKEKFLFDGDFHAYTRRRQFLISHIIQSTKPGCCGIDTDRYLSKKILSAYFPLHETEVRKFLLANWVKRWSLPSAIDANDLRNYFSEKTALYFAFLDFYTKALLVPTLIGFAVFGLQIVTTVNSNNRGVDGAISVWSEDTVITPFFCALLIFWAALFVKFWTRKSSRLTHEWGSFDYQHRERNRPTFKGLENPRFNKYTMAFEVFYPVARRYAKMMTGTIPMLVIIVGAAIAYVQVYLLKVYLYNAAFIPDIIRSLFAGAMTAVLIMILNQIYRRVARVLNNWENHRLQSKYENHFVAKIMAFAAINNYMSLLYVAFSTEYRGIVCSQGSRCLAEEVSDADIRSEDCDVCVDSVDRMQALGQQLLFVLLFKQILQNFIEIGIPFLKKGIKNIIEKRALKKQKISTSKENFSRAGKESKWADYDTFGDYEELVIQFGFVVLFAAAFPAAGIFALLNNIFEVHVDGYKLCTEFRRPYAQRASNIGAWLPVLKIITYIGIITNTLILGYTSNSLQNLLSGVSEYVSSYTDSETSWILVAIAIEHVLFVILTAIYLGIGDIPRSVLKEREGHKQYERKKKIEQVKAHGYDDESTGKMKHIKDEISSLDLPEHWHEAPQESRDDSEYFEDEATGIHLRNTTNTKDVRVDVL